MAGIDLSKYGITRLDKTDPENFRYMKMCRDCMQVCIWNRTFAM